MVDIFTQEFNRRLGSRTGRRAVDYASPVVKPDVRLDNVNRQQTLFNALVAPEKKSSKSKSKKRRSSISPDPVYGQFTQDAANLILENAEFDAPSDGGFFGGLWDKTKHVVGQGLNVAETVFDPLTRPHRSLANALFERAKAINEGQNTISSIDETIEGFAKGLVPWAGAKTGYGDVVEELSRRDETPGAGSDLLGNIFELATSQINPSGTGVTSKFTEVGLNPFRGSRDTDILERAVEESDGKFRPTNSAMLNMLSGPQFRKQLAGFGGEVAYDPLTYAGGAVIAKAAKGSRFADEAGKVTVQSIKKGFLDETMNSLEKTGLSESFSKVRPGVRSLNLGVDGKPVYQNLPAGNVELERIINESIDNAVFEVSGGMRTGRIVGLDMVPFTVSSAVGEGVRKFELQELTKFLDEYLDTTDDVLRLNNVPKSQLNKYKKNPYVQAFLDEFEPIIKKKGKVLSRADVDDAVQRATRELDDKIRTITDDLYNKTLHQVYNAPGVRVLGKRYGGVNRVGKAYSRYRAATESSPTLRALSFNRQISGRTRFINQKLRARGMRKYEEVYQEGVDLARQHNITNDEWKSIHNNIVKGITPSDPRLMEAQEWVKKQYQNMIREEIDAGVRPASDMIGDNYVYNFYKSVKTNKIKKYRDDARKAARANKKLDPEHVDKAKKLGLKPIENALEAVLLRKQRSNRLLTRAWLKNDLLDSYGITANRLSHSSARSRHLTKMSTEDLPVDLQKMLKEGEAYYIPDKVQGIYKDYMRILSGSSGEAEEFIRFWDRLNRIFKTSATVWWPGFHIRNSIGDIFMSYLDGVTPDDYRRALHLVNQPGDYQVNIGGRVFTRDEITQLFHSNASTGGFYRGDIPETGIFTKASPNRLHQKARSYSERREDFFRFAHFYRAFKDEYPKALKTHKSAQAAERAAIESATYRLNGSLFDYNALSEIEKKYIKRVIPFYTYNRKVMPAILEAAALNPNILGKLQRLIFDPNHHDYSHLLPADYIREIGYLPFGDEEEGSWLLNAGFLPTAPFRENLNFSEGLGGFGKNLISQAHPAIKAVIETAAEKKFFNDQPVDSQMTYAAESIPPVGPLRDFFSLSDTTRPISNFLGGSNKNRTEALLSGRIGLGLPFSQLDNAGITSSLYEHRNNITEQLKGLNSQLEQQGLKLILSLPEKGGNVGFKLRDEKTGRIIWNIRDADEAYSKALEYAKARK